MKIVLKIGGSILFEDGKISTKIVQNFKETLEKLRNEGHKIAVIIGGGEIAREYVRVAEEFNVTYTAQDVLGIEVSRINAQLFISIFPEAYPHPPRSYEELRTALNLSDFIFIGGLQPGQSTNAVASLTAEQLQADFLFNCSDVDYVYDKDPNEFKDAKPLHKLKYSEFISIVTKLEQTPGKYSLFDVVGAKIVERSKLKLCFIDGRTPQDIFEVIKGNSKGTIVHG